MKTSIFTNAWKLVKTLGYTLSAALKLCWAKAKMEMNVSKASELENEAFGHSVNKVALNALKEARTQIAATVIEFNAAWNEMLSIVNPKQIDQFGRTIENSNGAQYDYKQNVYNGD